MILSADTNLLPITGEGSRMIDPLTGIGGAMPNDLFAWHFNGCRQRARATTIERTTFSATGKDDFYVPEKFAKLWGEGEVSLVTVSAVAQRRLQNAVTDNIKACQQGFGPLP